MILLETKLLTRVRAGLLHGRQSSVLYTTRRYLLSAVSEVPVHSRQPERPITCMLGEDRGVYENSWQQTFANKFPNEYGIPSCYASVDESLVSFDGALQEMKQDASHFVDTVFVARGPWTSWLAQFYLESLPLKGLVLVDPIQLDDTSGIHQFQSFYKHLGLETSQQYQMFQEYAEHWGHWTLKLEPGSVPMMALHTTNQPELKKCVVETAQRHSVFNNDSEVDADLIPILELPANSPSHESDVVDTIAKWISERVL